MECNFLRSKQTGEPKEYINETLKMMLNYTESRSSESSSIKKQQTVLMREPPGFRLREAYTPHARFVPNTPLKIQKNGMIDPTIELYEDEKPEGQQNVARSSSLFEFRNGIAVLKIKLQEDRPIAAMMFRELFTQAENRESFAVVLLASDAAPHIDVVVPSTSKSLKELLKPYLEDLGKNHPHLLSRREPGPDQFILSLQSRHRLCVTFRKRNVAGDKVYYVYTRIERL